jgi:hypothetical protein
MKIDWFIPYHGKDKDTLYLSIESIYKNFSNVGKIFVVTNDKVDIDPQLACLISEPDKIDDIKKSDIFLKFKSMTGSGDRAGWVWQQILKLNADLIVPDISEVFIWQDSDVLWCRNQKWHLADVDAIFGKVQEYHIPYLHAFYRITGVYPVLGFSTIRHHEYIRKNILKEIRTDIANYHNKTFTSSIVDSLDYTEASNLSEYDLYVNWCVMTKKKAFLHDLVWQNSHFIPSVLPENFDFISPQQWMRNS